MRVHYLQHVPFEGLGSIGAWLTARGARVSATRLYDSEPLAKLGGLDLLIVLGGPMSVNDERTHPWLREEKRRIGEAVSRGTPVLGICLGAQLIASALGARVYRNPEAEIGWLPVRSTAGSAPGRYEFPSEADVFQWHGETFDLPPGAQRLAESDACANQAFQLGRSVIGIQFHLETTPDAARALVTHCAADLVPGPYVHPAKRILAVPPARYEEMNARMGDLLSFACRF